MANRIRSSKMRNVDYIILGQGIAGSNLSYELLKCGKEIVIFDNNWQDSACLVAAGVINPITGQRLVKSWRSALAHPYAKEFYKNLENKTTAVNEVSGRDQAIKTINAAIDSYIEKKLLKAIQH